MAADTWRLAVVFSGTVALAVVGAVDDLHVLEAVPRLLLQTAAVALVIAALPPDLRIINALPWWVERGIILVGGVWFVNLVNFMDGIDWMTVAEVVPVTAGIGLLGLMGALPQDATLVALAVCGAMIGFAPFNRPGGAAISRRRRQLADRLAALLVAHAARRKRPSNCGVIASTLLFG